MIPSRPMRIAMLTHSTNPRGGVVHALELAEALVAIGHEVVVHAPDPAGKGFFRKARCGTVSVKAEPITTGTVADMVELRVQEYVDHFENEAARKFDVFHAHDGISANALATLC
ncbi:MAG TPA: glycosyltransferase, partial [Afipia sp.]